MPRISEKRLLENEIASTIEVVALAMLLESDSESEEVEEDYDGLPRSHFVGGRWRRLEAG